MSRASRVTLLFTTLAVAFSVSVSAVFAQWPTSCVELNDIVERHRRHEQNVGIYQRAYGDQAEAACQADHRADVQAAFWWALDGIAPPQAADEVPWPTTCVDLNDIVEAHHGNDGNVGIYQRTFGNQAEATCRADHWGDVRQTFWWAVTAPLPPPAPTPAPAPAPTPTDNPAYEVVRQVAIARGAAVDLAATIAADVVGRGTVDAFLHGTDDSVLYGRYDCQWHSAACPLAPERPAPPPGPQIDPALQPAWDLMLRVVLPGDPPTRMGTGPLTVVLDWSLPADTNANYSPSAHTIYINGALRYERTEALAALLAHEVWHSVSPIPHPRDFEACVADEVWAFIIEAVVWFELGGFDRPASTRLEGGLNRLIQVLVEEDPWGAIDYDTDVSDWPRMRDHVLFDRGYVQSCAA